MKQPTLFPNDTDLPEKLGAPAERALANAKIFYVKDLSKWSEQDVRDLHGVGPTALVKLKHALKIAKLSFRN